VTTSHFDTYTAGRNHFADLLDAARDGRTATVKRDTDRAAVVDANRLRETLAMAPQWRAEIVAEAGGFSVFLPGVPVAVDGPTFEAAIDDMVDALREYAQDWEDRLRQAPNHRSNWGLVQLINLSDDVQLRMWLTGAAPQATAA
jgi:hypothetical protein